MKKLLLLLIIPLLSFGQDDYVPQSQKNSEEKGEEKELSLCNCSEMIIEWILLSSESPQAIKLFKEKYSNEINFTAPIDYLKEQDFKEIDNHPCMFIFAKQILGAKKNQTLSEAVENVKDKETAEKIFELFFKTCEGAEKYFNTTLKLYKELDGVN